VYEITAGMSSLVCEEIVSLSKLINEEAGENGHPTPIVAA
jgi:hypothetical protein